MILPKLNTLDAIEIQLAQIALTKGCRTDVKQYAQTISTDYTTHESQVRSLASQYTITLDNLQLNSLETQNVQNQSMALGKLNRMVDCDFDTAFMNTMISAQQFILQETNAARADSNKPDISSMLDTSAQQIQMHINEAQTLLSGLDQAK
jgi:predicted outer membrane protein